MIEMEEVIHDVDDRIEQAHEEFCSYVYEQLADDSDNVRANLIIDAFIAASEKMLPTAYWNVLKKWDNCYRVVCSNCAKSYGVGSNVPFDYWCKSRSFCVNCGAKMQKGAEMCDKTLNS